jgi:Tol biopolymer transport system component
MSRDLFEEEGWMRAGSKIAGLRRGARSSAWLIAAAAALLALAPTAAATYPGRNGKLAYETAAGNGSVVVFDGISSIPQSSAANCQGNPSNTDGQTDCTIGRINYSPDGKRIVAARQGAQGQLEVLDSGGKKVTVLGPLTSDDEEPAFAPGGRTIVFTGTVSRHQNLYEVSTDGSHLKQLTKHGGEWAAPCANGQIAYVNNGALYVMHADGSHVRRLVKRDVNTPDCAPNSRSVVYQGGYADFIVNLGGGKPKQIPGSDGMTPVFSPDGTRVAYTEESIDPQTQNQATFLVIARRNGHRLRTSEVGDGVVTSAGTLAWQPRH